MCAHGLPLANIEESCLKLVGPDAAPGPTLKHWKRRFVEEQPGLVYTCKVDEEAAESDRVKIEGRDLKTWIPHIYACFDDGVHQGV
jgi:hypothetical protein